MKTEKLLMWGGAAVLFFMLMNKGVKGLFGFFDNSPIQNLDELKKQYYKLAKIYHPDAGGSKAQFQDLQNEYEKLFKRILNGGTLSPEEKETEIELDENLRRAVDAIISLPGINIELVGKWIWITGNTYPIKEQLKAAGYNFAPVKKAWYYKGAESSGRGKMSLDEIRGKYGSERIKKDSKYISGVDVFTDYLKNISNLLDRRAA